MRNLDLTSANDGGCSIGRRGSTAAAVLLLFVLPASVRPAGSVPAPVPQQIAVITKLELTDARRKRTLPLKIYTPVARRRFPVILFCHGEEGSRDSFGPLARYWAGQGYVSIHPTFPTTRTESSARAAVSRARDVAFLLDSLPNIERSAPELRGRMDPKRIGAAGFSSGALVAMLLGGATPQLPAEVENSKLADPRVTAVLAVSPPGSGAHGFTLHSWRTLSLPLMSVTGDRDFGPQRQSAEWRRQPYRYSPAGDKYHVLIRNAHHYSFGGELSGGGAASSALGPRARAQIGAGRRFSLGAGASDRPEVFQAVKAATLKFWDAHLKDNSKAKSYLTEKGLDRDFPRAVMVEHR